MEVKNVVIVNDFNYIQGGASKVAIDTAKMIKDRGINVYFFSAVNRKDDNITGVEYITTEQNEALKEKNKIKGILNGIYNLKAKRKMKQLLKKLDNKNTIIHIHGWTKALSSSVFHVAFKKDFKVVLTLHDYFSACPNGGYFNYQKKEICNLKPLSWKCIRCNCDSRNYIFKLYRILRQFVQNKIVKLNDNLKYAIGVSEFSIQILKSTLPQNIEIENIYNPIKFNKEEKKIDTSKNLYYLYVGRISKEKGVELFCQAITELGVKGIVVGEGEEEKKLKEKYSNIEFTGWKNEKEVKEYMKGAKALIFPSLWYETAGLTILEAQVLGIPAIVNNSCAGKEFVNEEYTFKNIDDLKEKILLIEHNNIEPNIISNINTEQEYIDKIIKYYEKM